MPHHHFDSLLILLAVLSLELLTAQTLIELSKTLLLGNQPILTYYTTKKDLYPLVGYGHHLLILQKQCGSMGDP